LLVEAAGITPHIHVFRPFGASRRLFKFAPGEFVNREHHFSSRPHCTN
jgi:hypothetical protein